MDPMMMAMQQMMAQGGPPGGAPGGPPPGGPGGPPPGMPPMMPPQDIPLSQQMPMDMVTGMIAQAREILQQAIQASDPGSATVDSLSGIVRELDSLIMQTVGGGAMPGPQREAPPRGNTPMQSDPSGSFMSETGSIPLG